MPEYKSQSEVRKQAEDYVRALQDAGVSGTLLDDTFRDYCVKVSTAKGRQVLGNVIVYHNPGKDTYTLVTSELAEKSAKNELEDIWHGMSRIGRETMVGYLAFVDGSFLDNNIGYGAVILHDGNVTHEISGRLKDASADLMAMRQVGGEIKSVYEVMAWAEKNDIASLSIYYDYQGLEKWATGVWKAKNHHTEQYTNFIQNHTVDIVWREVDSHSGTRWNNRADELARVGARGGQDQHAQQDVDLVVELEDIVKAFLDFLAKNEVSASYRETYNDQFARITFSRRQQEHHLDIYNTEKKRLEPKWHGFQDEATRAEVKDLWRLFRREAKFEGNGTETGHLLDAADYYHQVLEPYRHLRFDFIIYAESLLVPAVALLGRKLDKEALRHDFDEIEQIHYQMKE